jgi:aryl-alcohol dehydrogenase-like predicted oxidoreductase
MTPFVIYQGAWNVMDRSFEREIIPMARSEGNCCHLSGGGEYLTK